LISSGSRTAVNPTGCPGLAKGGTGDVLTGLIAGLWAQMLASGRGRGDLPFWAAALGAWLHGRAGELAEAEKTAYAMTAQDVIEHLPAAFKELL
jgi:NAD(P)H-hydrate epimerase